jgi:predicted DNA-binding antitoxin AbrB/MazE fold protein
MKILVDMNLSPDGVAVLVENESEEASMSQTFEATFDGSVFHPDAPVELKPNTRVRITVESAEPSEHKSESFLRVARSLELQGPPDWSSHLDEYLHGEKSVVDE